MLNLKELEAKLNNTLNAETTLNDGTLKITGEGNELNVSYKLKGGGGFATFCNKDNLENSVFNANHTLTFVRIMVCLNSLKKPTV